MADCARSDRISSPAAAASPSPRAAGGRVSTSLAAAAAATLASLALTMIGTQYRLPRDHAARAIADGLAQSRRSDLLVRWSLPDTNDRAAAEAACQRLGLL